MAFLDIGTEITVRPAWDTDRHDSSCSGFWVVGIGYRHEIISVEEPLTG